jgi:hypothetical protein
VHIEVVCGGITKVKAPVAIGGHYRGVPLGGPAAKFDMLLDSWLTRALQFGMVGAGLGELFLVPLQGRVTPGAIAADNLLLAGAGDPGAFAPDDLRFLMANVTVAVKALGLNHLSTGLIGARRNELTIPRALRGFLEGVRDGFKRCLAMSEAVIDSQRKLLEMTEQPLFISLVEDNQDKVVDILKALRLLRQQKLIPQLELEIDRGENVPADPKLEDRAQPADLDPDEAMTLLRVTESNGAVGAPSHLPAGIKVLKYSALAERSVLSVREQEVNAYFVERLPGRLSAAGDGKAQEDFGVFFTNYLFPDDFRRLIEAEYQLTLVVDETTAVFPWEMAAFQKLGRTCFFGTDLRLARRFSTLLSPVPGSPPPLNRHLDVLVIADPAPGRLSLPAARIEGLTVVEVLEKAQQAWGEEYEVRATVRLGSFAAQDEERDQVHATLKSLRQNAVIQSAEACDPLELAMLIVNQHFDVIHFAGHGVFNPKEGQAGWVFDEGCVLSAQEIFRVRQVPRLVFANACFSAVTAATQVDPRRQLVGLAQAFFARGIQNYIGTGWQVDDALAADCARYFYRQALGLYSRPDGEAVKDTAPPDTLGDALAVAREAIRQAGRDSTWGAYQHYGRANDKLLPYRNLKRKVRPQP